MNKLCILKDQCPAEKRVAALPETVEKYVQQGFRVNIPTGLAAHLKINDEQ